MKSRINIIIAREFRERVAKKSFIITTLLMPVLMVLFMAAPALIAIFSTPTERTIAVADGSVLVLPRLMEEKPDHVTFVPVKDADTELTNERFDGVLSIRGDIADNRKSSITLYLHDAASIELESQIKGIVNQAIEDYRLNKYNIANLQEILDDIHSDVTLQTVRLDESGQGENTSSMLSYLLGIAMAFILYMFLLMYGQMVMTSIIEEKNNRVLELVVTSVKPMQLMLGKILGVGLVAVTQIVIWGVLTCMISAFLLPALLPESVSAQVEMFNSGNLDMAQATVDTDLLQAISILGSVAYIAKIFCYILLFLIGGFLFYASIFAAIGSAVDSVQDASQLVSFATIPIIIGLIGGMAVAQDPSGTLGMWLSFIPFTSPMVMLIRIPFDIPGWQIWASLGLLYLSFIFMAWVAAKIYRIGIFMHGKKPSIKDLYRWSTYK